MSNKDESFTHWNEIQKLLPNRTTKQISEKWRKVLNPNINKNPWTKEEDDKLRNFVHKNGDTKWNLIGESLGRTGKQCRERWVSNLRPNIKNDPWTPEEENLLADCVKEMGTSWSKIVKFFPHRSENNIKNRWYSNLRKRNKKVEKVGLSSNGSATNDDVTEFYFSCNDPFNQSFNIMDENFWI